MNPPHSSGASSLSSQTRDGRIVSNAMLAMGVAIIAILSVLGVAWRTQTIILEHKEYLTENASNLAQNINPVRLRQLSFTQADKQKPEFQRLRRQMIAYSDYASLRSIYTLREREGKLYFGPESIAENDPLASPPGTLYQNPPVELLTLTRNPGTICIGPYTDEYGSFISAYSTVIDPITNEVLATIGVDLPEQDWLREIRNGQKGVVMLGTTLCGLLVLAALLLRRLLSRLPPTSRFKQPHALGLLILLYGILLTTLLGVATRDLDVRAMSTEFGRLASLKSTSVEHSFVGLRRDLQSIARFIEQSEVVTHEEFQKFTAPLVSAYGIRSWEWVPRITEDRREELERTVRSEGHPDYLIHDKSPQGLLQPAPPRNLHFPVAYVSPHVGNEAALGYDMASEPLRYATLTSAANERLTTGTPPLRIIQDTEGQKGMLVMEPVYSGEGQHRGFALGGIIFQNIIDHAITPRDSQRNLMEVHLLDVTTKGPAVELASYPRHINSAPPT